MLISNPLLVQTVGAARRSNWKYHSTLQFSDGFLPQWAHKHMCVQIHRAGSTDKPASGTTQLDHEMYFVQSGTVEVMDLLNGPRVATLGPGSAFGTYL